jgi:DMSO/TMAO reductase YedYZ molybdopterin-dependent catalytic subunit
LFWRRKKEPRGELPPNQAPIPHILGWGVDHPGITHILPKSPKDEWSLTIDGEVESPLVLKWVDFLALPQVESVSDFHCVEGWSVLNQRWGGVLFRTIQERTQPRKSVQFVWFECADGYTTSLPLLELQGDDAVLAHRLNGEDLPQPLGGPMRLIVTKKYAYKSPMWLTRITFSTRDKLGFWERGYYSNTADVSKNDRYRTNV